MEKASKNIFSLVGLILGMFALGSALAHFWLGSVNPPPPVEEIVADKAVRIKDSLIAKFKDEPPPQYFAEANKVLSTDEIITITIVAMSFFTIILASIAYIRREDIRICGVATAMGVGAIAFQLAIVFLGMLAGAILIALIVSILVGGQVPTC